MIKRFHNGQRVQFHREPYWHLSTFITYAVIDGREQAIVRTPRTNGAPGHLHYCDVRDVRAAEFDFNGTPIRGELAEAARS